MLRKKNERNTTPTRVESTGLRLLIAAFALVPLINGAQADDATLLVESCKRYDRFVQLGSEDPVVHPCMTIDPDLGGLRRALAEYGIGISAGVTTLFNYNLRNDDTITQIYAGQEPTYAGSVLPTITYDLSRLGLNEGSQFVFKPVFNYNSYDGSGITGLHVNQLSARLPFWDNRIIVQAGVYYMGSQFYGSNIGDISGAAVLGSNSGLLFQTGISGWLPTPGVDIRFQTADERLYNHVGFSRSLSPLGPEYEWDHNRSGLNFHIKDSELAIIDEIGFRVASAPGQHKIWMRAGVIYNTSGYTQLSPPFAEEDNYGFYGVLDYQITQPDPEMPYKGWYINVKGNYGKPSVNAFAADVGATIYNIGPFQSRPLDLFAVSIGRNFISDDAITFYRNAGEDPARNITTASVSYALLVARGVYWNNTIAYTSTPTIVPQRKATYSILSSLTLGF